MTPEKKAQFENWNGEALVTRYDPLSGAWFIIGVHSTVLGPAGGGTRMKAYDTLDMGLVDAMRLSQGMTYKSAAAGMPVGGGKGVIALPTGSEAPRGEERAALLRRYGKLVALLKGAYYTASDVGTTDTDMDIISETAGPFVVSKSAAKGGAGMTAKPTAVGTFYAIQAVAGKLFGNADLAGKKVVVQGAGAVGGDVIARLLEAGAEVAFHDPSPETCEACKALGASYLEAAAVLTEPCDILSPNALGAIFDADSIARLNCKGIAGAANNQLASEADAELLKARGIIYAPDYVVNAGGAISGACLDFFKVSQEVVDGELRKIKDRLAEIFAIAERDDITTAVAARKYAEVKIAEGPAGIPGSGT